MIHDSDRKAAMDLCFMSNVNTLRAIMAYKTGSGTELSPD